MNIRHRRPALLATVVAAPLALALVACGSSADTQNASSPAEPTSDATSVPASTMDADNDASPDSTGDTGRTGLTAARTALAAVDGSTLFSVDREAGGWEATVVAGDGTESELSLSEDGATVTRGPVVDPDDADDTDDLPERQRLLQDVTVAHTAAVETARAEVPGGSVTGFDLDLDNGVATWDVQLDEDTADEQTVTIDAVSGAVLRVEQDD